MSEVTSRKEIAAETATTASPSPVQQQRPSRAKAQTLNRRVNDTINNNDGRLKSKADNVNRPSSSQKVEARASQERSMRSRTGNTTTNSNTKLQSNTTQTLNRPTGEGVSNKASNPGQSQRSSRLQQQPNSTINNKEGRRGLTQQRPQSTAINHNGVAIPTNQGSPPSTATNIRKLPSRNSSSRVTNERASNNNNAEKHDPFGSGDSISGPKKVVKSRTSTRTSTNTTTSGEATTAPAPRKPVRSISQQAPLSSLQDEKVNKDNHDKVQKNICPNNNNNNKGKVDYDDWRNDPFGSGDSISGQENKRRSHRPTIANGNSNKISSVSAKPDTLQIAKLHTAQATTTTNRHNDDDDSVCDPFGSGSSVSGRTRSNRSKRSTLSRTLSDPSITNDNSNSNKIESSTRSRKINVPTEQNSAAVNTIGTPCKNNTSVCSNNVVASEQQYPRPSNVFKSKLLKPLEENKSEHFDADSFHLNANLLKKMPYTCFKSTDFDVSKANNKEDEDARNTVTRSSLWESCVSNSIWPELSFNPMPSSKNTIANQATPAFLSNTHSSHAMLSTKFNLDENCGTSKENNSLNSNGQQNNTSNTKLFLASNINRAEIPTRRSSTSCLSSSTYHAPFMSSLRQEAASGFKGDNNGSDLKVTKNMSATTHQRRCSNDSGRPPQLTRAVSERRFSASHASRQLGSNNNNNNNSVRDEANNVRASPSRSSSKARLSVAAAAASCLERRGSSHGASRTIRRTSSGLQRRNSARGLLQAKRNKSADNVLSTQDLTLTFSPHSSRGDRVITVDPSKPSFRANSRQNSMVSCETNSVDSNFTKQTDPSTAASTDHLSPIARKKSINGRRPLRRRYSDRLIVSTDAGVGDGNVEIAKISQPQISKSNSDNSTTLSALSKLLGVCRAPMNAAGNGVSNNDADNGDDTKSVSSTLSRTKRRASAPSINRKHDQQQQQAVPTISW